MTPLKNVLLIPNPHLFPILLTSIHDCCHNIGPKCCPEISLSHRTFVVHSFTQSLTELFHIFFSFHKSPGFPPSLFPLSWWVWIYFNQKTEAIKGEFPKLPPLPMAHLYLFPCNLPILLGEFSVLLSKAKTSICALGTISTHPLKDLTSNLSFLSCIITFSLRAVSFPSTQRACCNTSHFQKQKNLTPRRPSTTTSFLC